MLLPCLKHLLPKLFHSLGVMGWRLGFSALYFAIQQAHLYFPLKLQCHWNCGTGPATLCFIPSTSSNQAADTFVILLGLKIFLTST